MLEYLPGQLQERRRLMVDKENAGKHCGGNIDGLFRKTIEFYPNHDDPLCAGGSPPYPRYHFYLLTMPAPGFRLFSLLHDTSYLRTLMIVFHASLWSYDDTASTPRTPHLCVHYTGNPYPFLPCHHGAITPRSSHDLTRHPRRLTMSYSYAE